jgi:integrase
MATIRKRNGRYQVQIRRQGQVSASRTFHKLQDAQCWGRQKELEADRGELLHNQRQLGTITLSDLVKRYLETVTPTKKSSQAETYVLRAFQKHRVCKVTLRDLNTSHFSNYRDDRLSQISITGLARELNTVRHIFNVARLEWNVPLRCNPLDGLRLDYKDNRRERRLKDGEHEKLLQAARTRQNPFIEKIVIFAIETGMRRGEILGLHWDQLDFQRRSVSILESKNGYSRTIPLTPIALALLRGIDRETKRVFPITANALRMAWERMLARTDIENLHFHDLRHEAISRFFEMGLTIPEVATISGHRDLKMLMRYAHANQSALFRKISSETFRCHN